MDEAFSKEKLKYSFKKIQKIIASGDHSQLEYNPSHERALLDVGGATVFYIDFKKKKARMINDDFPSVAFGWLSNDVAVLDGTCGSGCAREEIFFAPSIMVHCDFHVIKELEVEPYDIYPPPITNHPTFISTKRKIYGCQGEEGQEVEIYDFPKEKVQSLPR